MATKQPVTAPRSKHAASHRESDGSRLRFTIPAELVSFRSARPRRELTDEQRQAAAERLRRGREAASRDGTATA